MVDREELKRRFLEAVELLGFDLVDDPLHGPPAIEDLLADVAHDADGPIRALTLLCDSAEADAVAMTRALLDRDVDPENAAWAARLWAHVRDGQLFTNGNQPLTDPEPIPSRDAHPLDDTSSQAAHDAPSGTVALLFTDIEGSTKRWVESAAEMDAALQRHDALLRGHIEAHGGVVFTTVGDAFCAAFHGVDAAVESAASIQKGLSASDFSDVGGLRIRAAIHLGAVEARDGDYFGPELSRVARILDHTVGGQITLSTAAAAVISAERHRHLGDISLRDFRGTEAIYQLLGPGLLDDFPPLAVAPLPTRIPRPRTSFLGRGEIVASVADLVRDHRLVTLLGTGGLGKTRIAIEVSKLEADRRPVVVSELAPANDRLALEGTVLSDLDAESSSTGSMMDVICDAIADNDLLLVLDNCEQIVEEAAEFVEQLLRRCARLTVLATSREVLEVRGERIVRVAGLHESNLDEAVELFLARAGDAGVNAGALERKIVEELCVHLDGLPLAIELAAAKTAILPLAEIRAGLDNRLDLLRQRGRRSDGRHSSLRAMLDWSWELLDDDVRSSLARLSAFASVFGLEAAAAVLDQREGAAVDSLEELLARSLIVRESDPAAARYRMLESVRTYATEKAEDIDVRVDARARHLAWVADAVRIASVEIAGGSTAGQAMQRLDQEQHEIAAALDFATTGGDVTLGLQTAVNLWDWWRGRLRLTEGIKQIEGLLDCADQEADKEFIAGALVIRAEFLRMVQGPSPLVLESIIQARGALAAVTDEVIANRYRLRLALAEFDDEDEQIANELWSLVEAARSAGTTEDTMALHLLTSLAQPRDATRSLELARDTLSTAQQHNNRVAAAHARELIAIALTDLERTDEARAELAATVHTMSTAGQPACLLHCAESVAWYLYQSDRPDEAEGMYAAALGLRHRLHRTRAGFEVHAARQLAARLPEDTSPDESADIEGLVTLMRSALDD